MKYPKCSLASIITPGVFCVVSRDEEHLTEVKRVEERLAEEIQNTFVPDINLKCQMCVAVQTLSGEFKRGVIEDEVSDGKYEVLLIDYGETLIVDKSKIYIITNKAHLNVEPLSFIVKLFGVFPSKFCMINGVKKARVTQNWQPESEAFVRDLFVDNKEIIVQNILIRHRTVYGDIFFEAEPKKYKSLRKLLCKKEFCAYSKTNFLRQEGLDLPSDDSSDLETKMEFVKKWQRENFGDFQQCQTFPFSISLSSGSGDSTSESFANKDGLSTETAKSLPGLPKSSTSGRGKIKLLLSQMRNLKEGSSVNTESSTSESHSVASGRPGWRGKGRSLKRLEMEKSSDSKTENSPELSTSKTDDNGRFDDADLPETNQKIEDAVVKLGECSLTSDENLTENQTTQDSPPPLIRKNPVDIEFVKRVKTMKKTEIKTKPEKSESLESSSSEIKVLNSQEDGDRLSCKLKNYFPDLNLPLKHALRNYWTPFVVFGDSVVEPVNTFRELPIQASIIRNLEKGGTFSELSQVQRWAIPAIRKQHNTIVIGSSKTGKTLSYIVPLIDYVQDEFYFEELPEGNGPTIVVVASSSRVCESIYYMCHSLLGNLVTENMYSSSVRIVLAHGNGCEKEVWVKLTNGCDILISTPHCLARLLEYPVLTNFERLTCLVLDEVDVLSQKPFRKQVRVILEKAKLSTKNRHYQKIFCGEKWTLEVENFAKTYVESYALIIGSYLEAAIHERLKPSIYLVLQNRKAETLLEKVKDKIGKMKIVIVCETPSDATFVSDFLTENKISSLVAHEKMISDKLKEIGSTWRSNPQFLLVVTDGVLSEMKIREAQVLVHYGLPAKSKTNFFLRYSAFENFIRETRNVQRSKSKSHSSKLVDIILVDDNNHFQLPHIVDFVMRLGGKVSEKVLQKSEEIRRMIEVSKSEAPLCRNLLAFGRCRELKSCSQRHAVIKSSDSPGNLPSSGWVNFTVIKVHDASFISARLIEHVEADKGASKLSDRFLEIPVKLADFFKSKENRRSLGAPHVGDICAVKSSVFDQEVFYRAQVLEYLKTDQHGTPIEVSLKLLDQGDIWKRKSRELYELPKELTEHPPVAIDVRLAGLQPLDFDVSWSQIANSYVKDMLTQALEENQYWSGRIVLALNGVLFLDPVKRKQFLPHLNTHVFDLVFQDHLVSNRVAVRNEEHLPSLTRLCLEGEIELPRKEEVKREEDTAKIQPQWAFFDSDFVEVKFLAANHTSTVFLQPKKFEKVLDELEADCQIEGNKVRNEMSRKTKRSATSNLTVGGFCLAKFEDGKWNRGRIDSETENAFSIFFVDHGDFLSVPKTDVIPISQSLLLRLPCQAIECSLIGIHKEADCPIEILQEIYQFSDDGRLYLFALIIEKTKPELTGGRKYSLNLLNQEGTSLNKFLVVSGKVPAEESESRHLEDVEIAAEKEEEETLDEQPDEEIVEETTKEVPVTKYFEELGDDVFNNEEGLAFLKEFSSKCLLGDKTGPQNKLAITDGSEKVKVPPQAEVTKDSENGHSVQEAFSKKQKDLSLIKHEKVLTPQVLWSQNHSEVRMKIVVENVRDYSLECTATNLALRCFVKEKLYAFDLKLYGSINPQMTKLTLKAFHIVIILTKLVSPFWPRLHRDEGKHRWVSLDVESLTEKDEGFVRRIKSVKRDMEAGVLKAGVSDVKIRPCSDSENEEHELESECESD